nr:reverse transcriptase domain-containing protein [Tanacetum cinerariifolium]
HQPPPPTPLTPATTADPINTSHHRRCNTIHQPPPPTLPHCPLPTCTTNTNSAAASAATMQRHQPPLYCHASPPTSLPPPPAPATATAFRPLPPPWRAVDGRLATAAARLEDKLRHLKLRDMNIAAYTERFNKLALLCPNVVPNEKKKVELYIKGLPEIIKGETTSSRPVTLNEAMHMAHALMEQKIQAKNERIA